MSAILRILRSPASRFLLVVVLYAVTGRLGLLLSFVNSNVTLVWPPSGIAAAALLLLGIRYWPAVFIGAFLANLWNGTDAIPSLSIATGNTLAVVLAWYLLSSRFRIHHNLSRVKDVISLFLWGAMAAPVVSAFWGTATLVAAGIVPSSAFLTVALIWWVGDGMGILLLLPVILVFSSGFQRFADWKQFGEWVLSLSLLILVADLVLIGPFGHIAGYPLIYLLFPFMIWLSVRFGSRGAAAALFLTSVFSVWSTLRGLGPFHSADVHESLVYLHTYLFFTALSTLFLGAVIEEKRGVVRQLVRERIRSEEGSRLKSEFLANMSHEIRTPMAAILGYADLLEPDSLTEAQKRGYIQTIRTNGEHLLQILNDILDISQIESGRLTVQPVELLPADMLREMAELFAARAQKKGLDFSVTVDRSAPSMIHSDPLRLRQILVNLIGNAIKFTTSGSVHVDLTATASDDQCSLCFSIRDTGPGISEQERSKLFEPFVQGNSTVSRSFGGTGLGLAISSRLARTLGGSIQLESLPGRGSTFSVLLDLPVEHCKFELTTRSATPNSREDPGRHHKMNVLLAEDSPDLQILIRRMLESLNCSVKIAVNGEQALHFALENKANPFDIIFMDIQMPIMDGLRASEELRKAGYSGAIVALTAHVLTEERDRCLRAGMNDHLSKPLRRSDLAAVLDRFTVSVSGSR